MIINKLTKSNSHARTVRARRKKGDEGKERPSSPRLDLPSRFPLFFFSVCHFTVELISNYHDKRRGSSVINLPCNSSHSAMSLSGVGRGGKDLRNRNFSQGTSWKILFFLFLIIEIEITSI